MIKDMNTIAAAPCPGRQHKASGMQKALPLFALLLGLALPAHADDRDACEKASGDEAIAACTRLIEMGGTTSKSDLASVYNNRGIEKGQKGDLDGALADFTRAIELDRKSAGACVNRGYIKAQKGDIDGALADLDCAIERDPRHANAYALRSGGKGDKGDWDGAIADANRAIEIDPQNSLAYSFRGAAWGAKGDPEKALADTSRAIEIAPRNMSAYINRGNAKQMKGDVDGAIADYGRAIELVPRNILAYYSRGNAKVKKGDFDGAIADASRAIEIDPKLASAYTLRGTTKYEKGDLDGALADSSRALELSPQDQVALRNRGRVYFLQGGYAAAAKDFERAQQNPDPARVAYSALWLHLARAHSAADGKAELAASAARQEGGKWPAPLLEFYLGHGTPESLLAAAKNPDPKKQSGQLCEANFYLAEWLLLGNDSKGARPLLEYAAKQCPRDYIEYGAAMIELRRLAK